MQFQHSSVTLTDWPQVSGQLLSFDESSFTIDAFAEQQITLPDHLRKAATKRQAEYLAGRCAAKIALTSLQAENWQVSSLASTEKANTRVPVWPTGFTGSISHSRDLAIALVAPTTVIQAIGVDIEHRISDQRAEQLQRAIVCDQEIAKRPATMSLAKWLMLVFSAKEALYKALYAQVQHYFGFHKAHCLEVTANTIRLQLTEQLHDACRAGQEYHIHYIADDDRVISYLVLPRANR